MCNRDQFEQFPPPRVFYPLSFDTHPNSFARIPFPLMLIQTAQGMAICVRTEAIAKRRTLLSRSFVTSFLFNRLRTLCTNQPLKKRRNSFVFFRFHTLGKMMGGWHPSSAKILFSRFRRFPFRVAPRPYILSFVFPCYIHPSGGNSHAQAFDHR